MSTVIFIVVAVIALAVLVDFRRSKTNKNSSTAANNQTANEAMPTQTGRFRAQQALSDFGTPQQAAPANTGSQAPGAASDDEEHPLPDPFDRERQ